ncbi:glutathione transferase GstA [Pseudemcibacter aquimaris]|uniref:glutathione transferase GstA n=1 Tax=Pseudemcibacter aquimaris TaxID=2857064 RepID=UPI002012BE82|nr:glutathione transferase GstA [Pseudemcibacter aquimaris]MCC3861190.1 glutathione transferase GstA [Pseudemcibacter aquimaris]WDU57965.1 glutathione transferase GstA [Pseudemcibacter aquimaris]
MMKLYYLPGACSMASHITLNELNMDFSIEKVIRGTGTTENGEDYSKINPLGYVPALKLNDGTSILENTAILTFIADLKPESGLAPKDSTVARAKFNETLGYLSSELHKAYSPIFAEDNMTDERKETVIKKLNSRLDYLEDKLNDGRSYLFGDNFTAADAYAFVIMNWSNFIDHSLEAWPNIKAFLARTRERPSVQRALKAEGLLS